jgi:DNA polymerase-3 subunit delta'
MSFKDIIGQDEAIGILRGFIRRGRVPHTLCFTGDDGIGKRLTAMNFAMALNCVGASSDAGLFAAEDVSGAAGHEDDAPDACGECPSCRKVMSGNHPDVHLLTPQGDARQIKVAEVRQLEEALSFRPFEGQWKVAIVDDADRINEAAANAFLKTLEEPAAHSVIVLVTSRPDMLLPTIRSRCQMVRFSPLPVEELGSFLESRLQGISDGEAMLRSRLSGGRPGLAQSDDILEKRDWSLQVLKKMIGSPDEEAWSGKEEMEEWFDWSVMWMRDFAVYRATGDSSLLINADLKDEIGETVRSARLDELLKLARELYDIRRRLGLNLNKQLTLNHVGMMIRAVMTGNGI